MPEYGLGTARGAIIITYDGAGVAKAEASVASLQGKTAAAGAGMAKVGKTMAITGAIIAGGLAIAAKGAVDFQSKMNLLVTAAGESPKALGVVSEGIKRIAVQTGTSLDQLADGMYLVEKAGYRGAKGLQVLQASAEGARAENVDMATFTSALTSVMTSYGLSADQAVTATNQMIVASGRSKTTMQEFAGALSTVLPIASALGISFDQVGGAIATLTQHGTSAREATQELANLIRNLAGQNNVASGAMQQLGINVVDLQKNLGKRGITGTLDIVEKALAKSSKGGLVVVDSFKKSQLATQSLNEMIKSMPPQLAKMSKELLSGKIGMSDYKLAANGLGARIGPMGLQFLALLKSSQGFNDQLKSGNGDVRTAAATLQKMLGGATGLRTALQLGGTSASLFAKNTKAIGDAADKTGKHIDTWARTSGTAAVKLAQLKAAGEVFGVTMGNIVLPAILAIVKVGTSFLNWLTSLPAPVQKAIGITALAAASFLLLGSLIIKLVEFGRRLGSAFATIAQGAYSLVSRMLGVTAANEATAVSATSAAEAEAALELAMSNAAEAALAAQATHESAQTSVNIAYQNGAAAIKIAETEVQLALDAVAASATASATAQEEAQVGLEAAYTNLSTTVSRVQAQVALAESSMAEETVAGAAAQETALAELTAARQVAADAALAASEETAVATSTAFGPIGIAIAAVVGVGAAAAGALGLFGGSAKHAIGPVDALTDAIKRDNDALGANTRSAEIHRIQQDGLYDAGLKLGLTQKQVTDAVLGNKDAMNLAQSAIHNSTLAYDQNLASLKRIRDEAIKHGSGAAARVSDSTLETRAYNDLTKAQQNAYNAAKKLSGGLFDEKAALEASKHAADNETAAAQLGAKNDLARAKAVKALSKENDNLKQSYEGLNVQVAQNGTALPFAGEKHPSAAAQSNAAFLKGLIAKTNEYALAQLRSGASLDTVNSKLNSNLQALRKQAVQSGYTGAAIDDLINKYGATPKQLVTKLIADTSKATASADQLQALIGSIRQGKVPGLSANSAVGRAVIAELQRRIDALEQHKKPPIDADTNPAKAEIETLQNRIDDIRQGRVPGLTADSSNGRAVIAELQGEINRLEGKTVYIKTIHVNVNVNEGAGGAGPALKSAAGGRIVGPGTETSDDILMLGSNNEHMWSAAEVRGAGGHSNVERMRGLARAGRLRKMLPGFATGGKIDKNRISTAISAIGTAYSDPIVVSNVGISRIRDQIRNAVDILNQEIAHGLSRTSADAFRAAIVGVAKNAEGDLANLRIKIHGGDIEAIRNALTKTVSDTKTAFSTLVTDLKRIGSPDSLIKSVEASAHTLYAAQATLSQYNAVIDTARRAVAGSFSITSALDNLPGTVIGLDKNGRLTSPASGGTGEALVAGEEKAAKDANAFAYHMRRIQKWLPERYYNQLLAAGPTPTTLATVRALDSLTSTQRARFVAGARAIYDTGTYLGTVSAQSDFGAGAATAVKTAVDHMAALINSKLSAISKSNDTLLKAMLSQMTGKHYAAGGWTTPGLAMVHRREYMLSEAMLAGRQGVDPRVLGLISSAQVRAATGDMSVPGSSRGLAGGLDTRELTIAMARVDASVQRASAVEAAMLVRVEDAMRYVGPDAAGAINSNVGARALRLRRTSPSVRHP